MLASWLTTVKDLGIPGLLGAVVGAMIGHYTAKARGREEHERTLDLLVLQDERRAAQTALDAVRAIRVRLNSGDEIRYGALHNEWSDTVLAPSRIVRNAEIGDRVQSLGYVIFLATLAPEEYVSYAVLRAALDVEEALEALLRRDPMPARHVPAMDEVRALVFDHGRVKFERFNDYLEQRV